MYKSEMIVGGAASGWNKVFGRHFVSMIVGYQKDGTRTVVAFSAFVAELHGNICLVTAGHVIKTLVSLEKSGYKIDTWDLNDNFAGGRHNYAVGGFKLEARHRG